MPQVRLTGGHMAALGVCCTAVQDWWPVTVCSLTAALCNICLAIKPCGKDNLPLVCCVAHVIYRACQPAAYVPASAHAASFCQQTNAPHLADLDPQTAQPHPSVLVVQALAQWAWQRTLWSSRS